MADNVSVEDWKWDRKSLFRQCFSVVTVMSEHEHNRLSPPDGANVCGAGIKSTTPDEISKPTRQHWKLSLELLFWPEACCSCLWPCSVTACELSPVLTDRANVCESGMNRHQLGGRRWHSITEGVPLAVPLGKCCQEVDRERSGGWVHSVGGQVRGTGPSKSGPTGSQTKNLEQWQGRKSDKTNN